MEKISTSLGPIVSRLSEFLQSDFFLGLFVALLSSWGAVVLGEKWATKRDQEALRREDVNVRQERMLAQITEIVKWYQVNVRILRQPPNMDVFSELNVAHASFIAHTKMLRSESGFEAEEQELRTMSRDFAKLWSDETKPESRARALAGISDRFGDILNRLIEKVNAIK